MEPCERRAQFQSFAAYGYSHQMYKCRGAAASAHGVLNVVGWLSILVTTGVYGTVAAASVHMHAGRVQCFAAFCALDLKGTGLEWYERVQKNGHWAEANDHQCSRQNLPELLRPEGLKFNPADHVNGPHACVSSTTVEPHSGSAIQSHVHAAARRDKKRAMLHRLQSPKNSVADRCHASSSLRAGYSTRITLPKTSE